MRIASSKRLPSPLKPAVVGSSIYNRETMLLRIARWCLAKLRLRATYNLHREGYLREVGWFRSFEEHGSVDAKGNSIPYITYPAIDFLERKVRRDMRVFEYGSGASTLWWAERVETVVACEHDASWFEKISAAAPLGVTLHHIPLEYGGEYCQKILEFSGEFDLVVVDGRDRVRCAKNAVQALTDRGVIVWDNTDRERYSEGYQCLLERGFRRLDFTGPIPIQTAASETSIFYRDGNCLGISWVELFAQPCEKMGV